MMEDPVGIATAIAGGGAGGIMLTSYMAKAYISKGLRDLDSAITRIADINTELASITARLEELSKTHKTIREIDRKVVEIETRLNGRYNKPYRR